MGNYNSETLASSTEDNTVIFPYKCSNNNRLRKHLDTLRRTQWMNIVVDLFMLLTKTK